MTPTFTTISGDCFALMLTYTPDAPNDPADLTPFDVEAAVSDGTAPVAVFDVLVDGSTCRLSLPSGNDLPPASYKCDVKLTLGDVVVHSMPFGLKVLPAYTP